MDTNTKKRFWRDLIVPTQTESEEVAFANPSDVARSFILARNWHATVSEELADANKHRELQVNAVADLELRQENLERLVIARVVRESGKLPTSAVKTKQTMHIYALAHANEKESELFEELGVLRGDAFEQKHYYTRECNELEAMRRTIEKTTEWLSQYLNWYKFELRERV